MTPSRGRILMVVRPSKGGAFGHALRLCREMEERGYECAIAGPHDHLATSSVPPIFHIDIPRQPRPVHHSRAVARLAGVYRSFEPDVVHAHGSQGGVVARLARIARPSTPVVFTPHNYAFMNYFESARTRAAYRAIETTLSPLATRVLCVCRNEQEVAATVGPRSRTRVVYNGIVPVRTSKPPPEIAALGQAGPLVCTVAELQPPKGVTTLIGAMPRVLDCFPDANLAVAGDGVERARIEEQISQLGIGNRVHLLGSVDDIAGLLNATDVFAQPGWSESFPYSVLEAMSLGLPIAATDVGGVGEAVEDGVTGRLVAPKDDRALADAIIHLISEPERARVLGAAARDRMMSMFRLDQTIDGTLAVYREVGLS